MSDQDLDDPVLADEWSTECSDPDWSDNCNGNLETACERKKELCQGCLDVIASWSDDEDADDSDTEQMTLVTDGGIDTCSSDTAQSSSAVSASEGSPEFAVSSFENSVPPHRQFGVPTGRIFSSVRSRQVYTAPHWSQAHSIRGRPFPFPISCRFEYGNQKSSVAIAEITLKREVVTDTSYDGGTDDA